MPDTEKSTETWEVKVAESILGILFLGARKGGRGPWLTLSDLPQRVRDYVLPEVHPGAAGRVALSPEVGRNLDELEAIIEREGRDRFGQRKGNQATIWVEVEKPPAPRPKRTIPRGVPAIRNLEDLMDHFGAHNPDQLNRRVFNQTEARASTSISVQTTDGIWHHNGDDDWRDITEIVAFTIQTTIEDSDAMVASDEFVLPVTVTEVNDWIEEMEAEAERLWEYANKPDEPDEPEGVLDWWPEN